MAERGGFEPPIDLRLCLISSQVHSTGLCHLSTGSRSFFIMRALLPRYKLYRKAATCQANFHRVIHRRPPLARGRLARRAVSAGDHRPSSHATHRTSPTFPGFPAKRRHVQRQSGGSPILLSLSWLTRAGGSCPSSEDLGISRSDREVRRVAPCGGHIGPPFRHFLKLLYSARRAH